MNKGASEMAETTDETVNSENEAALQWLDDAYRFARRAGRPKLVRLLETVRTEIASEIELDNWPGGKRPVPERVGV